MVRHMFASTHKPANQGPLPVKIPLVDLRAQNAPLTQELVHAVDLVLQSGRYSQGPDVERFEQAFAAFCDVANAVAVSSGTSALHLACLACGIGAGDEVITTALTFVATVAAVQYCGARPILVDVEPRAWTIDPAAVRRAITPRTKAIIAVHLHGRPADMTALSKLAREHNLVLIEDASQAHGAMVSRRRVGGIGDIGTFSFYPAKPLGALGEGGAVVTNDPKIAEKVRLLRNWGHMKEGVHSVAGFNMRMDAIQAAVLMVKLNHVQFWTASRSRHAERYRDALDNLVDIPAALPDTSDVHHVFAIGAPERTAVRAALLAAGIETGMHYRRPVHLQPAYANLGYREGDFPVAESVASRTLSLPLFAELDDQQVDHVCCSITRVLSDISRM